MEGSSIGSPREFGVEVGSLTLESGHELENAYLAAWTWGPAQRERASGPGGRSEEHASPLEPSYPTVLLVHALTGDARAGGEGGWWAPLVGPDRPLDPRRVHLLCFNNLGSCYGSYGPNQEPWPRTTDPVHGSKVPAPVTTWDQARAILRGLDQLGIDKLRVAIGGSLGGMLVLALGALAPDRFQQLIPIAASVAASSWILGFNHIARQIILRTPDWRTDPRGLELARQLAQMTYRHEQGLELRQGRRMRTAVDHDEPLTEVWQPSLAYAQQTYLEHQGRKLADRFDPESYLLQLAAMDHHDIRRRPPNPSPLDSFDLGPKPWVGPERLEMPIDAIGIDTDVLYPETHVKALAEEAANRRYHGIVSKHGHDGFLIEWSQLSSILFRAGAPFDEEVA